MMFLILFVMNLLTVYSASQDIKTSVNTNEADKKEQKSFTINSYVSDIQECIKEAQQGIIDIELIKKIFDTTKNHYKAFYEIKDLDIKRAEIRKIYDTFLPLYEILKKKQKYEQPELEEHIYDLEYALRKIKNAPITTDFVNMQVNEVFDNFYEYYKTKK